MKNIFSEYNSYLVTHANIINTAPLTIDKDMSIFIVDGKIVEISKKNNISQSVLEINCAGKYIIPGLIDCHAHPFLTDTHIAKLTDVSTTLMTARAINILNDMLMRGFTTIRDAAGGDWGIKQAVEEGEVIGPRMFIAGRALTQTGGHGDFRSKTQQSDEMCACSHALGMTARIADGEDEIRRAVRDEFRKGADQIKIMVSGGVSSPNDPLECDQYSEKEIRVVTDEAKRRNSYVMAHAYGGSAIYTAIKSGVRSIEHGNLINKRAAALAAEKSAFVVPTLVTYQALSEKSTTLGWSNHMKDKLSRIKQAGLQSLELCENEGVEIGFGTDLLGDGFYMQSEEFIIRREVQNSENIIHSATKVNAKIIQKEGQLGVIKKSAIADLLVLEKNPIEDISALCGQGENISLIMKEGRIYKYDSRKFPKDLSLGGVT